MLEKWKQWAVKINFKKTVVIFMITGLVLVLGASAAIYGNFQGRIAQWEQLAETEREYGEEEKTFYEGEKSGFQDRKRDRESREHDERDWEGIHKTMHLSWGDIALIAGCGIIGTVLSVWYWLLVVLWAYRKAYRMGVNTTVWVFAALILNLMAIAALYLYEVWRGACTNCGRIISGNGKYCDRCGSPLKRECPKCGQEAVASAVYCGSCGVKLEGDEKEK